MASNMQRTSRWLTGAVALAFLAAMPWPHRAAAQAPPAGTTVRVEAPAQALSSGDELQATVLVERVDHLAAFDFVLQYDADRLRFERVEGMGEFLASGERDMNCGDSPLLAEGSVTVSCFTLNPPLSLQGPAGTSGDGLLARLIFTARKGGEVPLDLTKTALLSDDVQPPGDPEGSTVDIPHDVQSASLRVVGEDSFPWMSVVIALAVAAGVAATVGGGLWWYRSRGRTLPSPAPPDA